MNNNESKKNKSDIQKMTISELKTRLAQLNVQFDKKKHAKEYYVGLLTSSKQKKNSSKQKELSSSKKLTNRKRERNQLSSKQKSSKKRESSKKSSKRGASSSRRSKGVKSNERKDRSMNNLVPIKEEPEENESSPKQPSNKKLSSPKLVVDPSEYSDLKKWTSDSGRQLRSNRRSNDKVSSSNNKYGAKNNLKIERSKNSKSKVRNSSLKKNLKVKNSNPKNSSSKNRNAKTTSGKKTLQKSPQYLKNYSGKLFESDSKVNVENAAKVNEEAELATNGSTSSEFQFKELGKFVALAGGAIGLFALYFYLCKNYQFDDQIKDLIAKAQAGLKSYPYETIYLNKYVHAGGILMLILLGIILYERSRTNAVQKIAQLCLQDLEDSMNQNKGVMVTEEEIVLTYANMNGMSSEKFEKDIFPVLKNLLVENNEFTSVEVLGEDNKPGWMKRGRI